MAPTSAKRPSLPSPADSAPTSAAKSAPAPAKRPILHLPTKLAQATPPNAELGAPELPAFVVRVLDIRRHPQSESPRVGTAKVELVIAGGFPVVIDHVSVMRSKAGPFVLLPSKKRADGRWESSVLLPRAAATAVVAAVRAAWHALPPATPVERKDEASMTDKPAEVETV